MRVACDERDGIGGRAIARDGSSGEWIVPLAHAVDRREVGGIELGYTSDLDLVFLHDSRGEVQRTDGAKPLDNGVFFLRLGQRIVHLLSWHQIQNEAAVGEALKAIKDANRIPEEQGMSQDWPCDCV